MAPNLRTSVGTTKEHIGIIMTKICLIPILGGILFTTSFGQREINYRVYIETPFKPVEEPKIEYPEILKKEGLASRITLLIKINKKGKVDRAGVWKSLYPELNKEIEASVKKWNFEPMLHQGEPIPAVAFAKVIFLPEEAIRSGQDGVAINEENIAEYENGLSEDMKKLLDSSAEYSQKLFNVALYYVCLEKIDETINKVSKEYIGTGGIDGGNDLANNEKAVFSLWDLVMNRLKDESYIFDYQMIRKQGKIDEKRVLLGKTEGIEEKNKNPLQARLSYFLQPIVFPERILNRKYRFSYSFRMMGEEEINGHKTVLLSVSPKKETSGDFLNGKIWVEKDHGRILKIEMETNTLDGYPEIYEECTRYHLKPHFTISHDYRFEKYGLLFPRQSEIRIEYSGLSSLKKELKAKARIDYHNYRFFNVDTQSEIIK
jgi:TonB family protein